MRCFPAAVFKPPIRGDCRKRVRVCAEMMYRSANVHVRKDECRVLSWSFCVWFGTEPIAFYFENVDLLFTVRQMIYLLSWQNEKHSIQMKLDAAVLSGQDIWCDDTPVLHSAPARNKWCAQSKGDTMFHSERAACHNAWLRSRKSSAPFVCA